MAEEQGGFSIWLAMPIVFILLLVFMLKKDETKHLTGGYEELNSEVSKQLNSGSANRM
jgi:hypothetical protein